MIKNPSINISKIGLPLRYNQFSAQLSKEQVDTVTKAANKILTEVTNLGSKGVNIVDAKNIKLINSNKKSIKFLETVKAGKNAGFIPNMNTIIVNREKLSLATFHELGHAFNFNNSKFWKFTQKLKVPSVVIAATFTLLPVLTKDSKAQDGEELTKGQKFKNTLRKFSPALAFGSMLPILAEEGMASIRGCKWAKKLLDPSLYKKLVKTNIVVYSSYLLPAVALGVAAMVSKNIKDNKIAKAEQNA